MVSRRTERKELPVKHVSKSGGASKGFNEAIKVDEERIRSHLD